MKAIELQHTIFKLEDAHNLLCQKQHAQGRFLNFTQVVACGLILSIELEEEDYHQKVLQEIKDMIPEDKDLHEHEVQLIVYYLDTMTEQLADWLETLEKEEREASLQKGVYPNA